MVFNCMQSKELISPRVLLLICDLHRSASEHARKCPRGCRDVSFCCCHPYSFELITGLAINRTVISGLRYPIPAAAVCGLWALSRFVYTVRYGAGDPKKVCFILNMLPWPTSLIFYCQSSAFFQSKLASSYRLVRVSAVFADHCVFLTYLFQLYLLFLERWSTTLSKLVSNHKGCSTSWQTYILVYT